MASMSDFSENFCPSRVEVTASSSIHSQGTYSQPHGDVSHHDLTQFLCAWKNTSVYL